MRQARPSLGPTLCEPPLSVLRFLLKRLQVKKFDENKLYCSEILAMLVNGDTDVQKRLGTLQGESNNHWISQLGRASRWPTVMGWVDGRVRKLERAPYFYCFGAFKFVIRHY